jgi:hypothetical protein
VINLITQYETYKRFPNKIYSSCQFSAYGVRFLAELEVNPAVGMLKHDYGHLLNQGFNRGRFALLKTNRIEALQQWSIPA